MLAIKHGRIVFTVGKVDHTIGRRHQIIDAAGYTLVPWFLDGHLHDESSMLSVREFTRSALPREPPRYLWILTRLPMYWA